MKSATISSALLLVGAVLYLSACGPENLNDPNYLAQVSESGINYKEMDFAKEHMKGHHRDDMKGYDKNPVVNVEIDVNENIDVIKEPGKKYPLNAMKLNAMKRFAAMKRNNLNATANEATPEAAALQAKPEGCAATQAKPEGCPAAQAKPEGCAATQVQPAEPVVTEAVVGRTLAFGVGGLNIPYPYQGYLSFGSRWGVRPFCDRYYSGGFFRYCR